VSVRNDGHSARCRDAPAFSAIAIEINTEEKDDGCWRSAGSNQIYRVERDRVFVFASGIVGLLMPGVVPLVAAPLVGWT